MIQFTARELKSTMMATRVRRSFWLISKISWGTRSIMGPLVVLVVMLAATAGRHGGAEAVSLQAAHVSGTGSDGDPVRYDELERDHMTGAVGPEADGRSVGHEGNGGIYDLDLPRPGSGQLEPQPLPPIAGCPSQCRCYYKAYRGAGVSDKLLTVNCSALGLVEFPVALPPHTQVLDMSANSVLNLTSLPRLPELLVLDLSNNWLRYLDNRWLFEHVARLAVLNLAHNALRGLQHGTFLGLSHLLQLDISGNRLQRAELHAFADLKRLEVFRMDGNGLFHVKRAWFKSMPNVVEVRLSDNGLVSLDPGTLPLARLQHLDLSQNRLRRLDHMALAGLDNLRLVNLSDNHKLLDIPNEALRVVPRLDILLLDGLGVVRLDRHAVSGLSAVELSLSYMPELRAVGRAAFHNLTRLQTLQLHDCPRLAFLHPEAFAGLPELRRLLIHNNALVAVSQRVVASLPRLGDLHLYHNPFRCDCNVFWLRRELSEYSRHHYAYLHQENVSSSASSPALDSARDGRQPVGTSGNTTIIHSTTASSISQGSNINPYNHYYSTIISEPGRVSCFFPDGASSMPLVQQPLQYFPETCPPVALAFFPARVNVSLGEPLDLECVGLGVPQPSVSWVLPNREELIATAGRAISAREAAAQGSKAGQPSAYLHQPGDTGIPPPPSSSSSSAALSSSSSSSLTDGHHYGGSTTKIKIRDETTLHIPVARLQDSGSYGCRVRSALGHDYSSVMVHVQPKPLSFTEVTVSNQYITVAWEGSIPRAQMQEFQLFYRKVPQGSTLSNDVEGKDTQGHVDKLYGGDATGMKVNSQAATLDLAEHGNEFSVLNLRRTTHTFTISGLEPQTIYEVCLVYRGVHPIQCRLLTTTARDVARVVRTGAGIAVRVSKAQIGAGIGLAVGALVLIWAGLVFRRLRCRGRKNYQDYADPLREEKASIPLEGLASSSTPCGSAAPNTPLTSSRTALLTHSQI